ncbi:MAG TPA: hypothetical protein VF218_03250 [Acidothermaceae bacterium]
MSQAALAEPPPPPDDGAAGWLALLLVLLVGLEVLPAPDFLPELQAVSPRAAIATTLMAAS